ncbi:MAG: adenine-specific DNA-methyltransferase [Miltoncostaeaceae bacterium]|jgi:site-specific DNA-methyltransferase (adenine-specific)|nr:adenine-specific DNA-methyltransferase [Miltoncostaeaceae bacterium]
MGKVDRRLEAFFRQVQKHGYDPSPEVERANLEVLRLAGARVEKRLKYKPNGARGEDGRLLDETMLIALPCAAPACMDPVDRYGGREDQDFCSDACRMAFHRAEAGAAARRRLVRLYRGDVFDFLRCLRAESMDLCVTDFPYPNAHAEEHYDVLTVDHWPALCAELHRVLKRGRRAYLWANNEDTLEPMDVAMRASGFTRLRHPHQWIKTRRDGKPAGQSRGGRTHELVAVYGKAPVRPLFGRLDNLLYAPRPRVPGFTPKPVSVLEDIIRAGSQEGERVLDPFAGSGSTALAAAATGRRAWTCEVDQERLAYLGRKLDLQVRQLAEIGPGQLP